MVGLRITEIAHERAGWTSELKNAAVICERPAFVHAGEDHGRDLGCSRPREAVTLLEAVRAGREQETMRDPNRKDMKEVLVVRRSLVADLIDPGR